MTQISKATKSDAEVLMVTPEEDTYRQKVFEKNLANRTIIFNDLVDEKVMERAMFQILQYNREDRGLPRESRRPIYLHISSYGGEVQEGISLINVIQNSKTPVYGVCHKAYSMAAYIFICCDERYAYKNSTLMFHDGSTALSSSSSKVKDTIKWLEELEERLDAIVYDNGSISEDTYEEKRRKEWYMFGDQAKSYGFVDKIIGVDIEQDYIC